MIFLRIMIILTKFFSFKDPNQIAEVIVNEISIIIEAIARSKKLQCKNDYAPWLNKDFIAESKSHFGIYAFKPVHPKISQNNM